MATATFRPQAWIRDYAVEVDPEGPTTWEVSPDYLAMLVKRHGMRKLVEPTDAADDLRDDPAAPEWIREWQGPFDVSLIDEEQMAELEHGPDCRPEDMTEPDEQGIRDCRRCGLWEVAPHEPFLVHARLMSLVGEIDARDHLGTTLEAAMMSAQAWGRGALKRSDDPNAWVEFLATLGRRHALASPDSGTHREENRHV